MANEQTFQVGSTLAPPLAIGHTIMYGGRFSENTGLWYGNSLFYAK
jgi:hypothetical protein